MKYLFGLQFLLVCTAYSQHYDFIGTDFSRIDSIAINYKINGKLDPKKVTKDLIKGLESDLDKYRVIFRWIAENIEYDVKLYRMTISHDYDAKLQPGKYKRWKKRFDKLYKRHTLLNRMTICEGYAWILETMCREAGLSCVSVIGHARTKDSKIGGKAKPNHAWNAIKIDSKWYLSDPTWASGGVNEMLTRYIKHFNEVYFIANPDEFIANHFPTDTQWTLLYKRPSLVDFINAPIRTTGFLENKIPNYSPLAGNIYLKKDSVFEFHFSINKELESFAIEKSTYRNKKFITETIGTHPIQNKEGYYVSSISFPENGNYSVWIYINRKHTFIYKVFVK